MVQAFAVYALLVLAAYVVAGRLLVEAAHWGNPALRRSSQISQFLAVTAWPIALVAANVQRARHRRRLK